MKRDLTLKIKQIITNNQGHLTSDEQEIRKRMIVDATQKPPGEALPINREGFITVY